MIYTLQAKDIYTRVKAEVKASPKTSRTRFEKGNDDLYDCEYILTKSGSYIFRFNAMHSNNYKEVLNGDSLEYVASVEVA